jgi:hypothetical protein
MIKRQNGTLKRNAGTTMTNNKVGGMAISALQRTMLLCAKASYDMQKFVNNRLRFNTHL